NRYWNDHDAQPVSQPWPPDDTAMYRPSTQPENQCQNDSRKSYNGRLRSVWLEPYPGCEYHEKSDRKDAASLACTAHVAYTPRISAGRSAAMPRMLASATACGSPRGASRRSCALKGSPTRMGISPRQTPPRRARRRPKTAIGRVGGA